jgi:hypothetical protein
MKDKQKPKDWKITKFLKDKAPHILESIGDVLPDKGALGILKNLITKDTKISKEDKELLLKQLELDAKEYEEITKRWESDNKQDLKLPKLIRPIVLSVLVGLFVLTVVLSFFDVLIPESYLNLLELILLTVIGAYFGARTVEKYHNKKY